MKLENETMDNNWKVYCHIFPNGKSYIGITHRAVEERWGKKGEKYKGQVVGAAIAKYGWDNIQHIILKEGLNRQQANYYEQQYIKTYNSHISQNGYNATWGGEGVTTIDYEAVYQTWLEHPALDYVANCFNCNKATVRIVLDSYNVPKTGRGSLIRKQKVNQYDITGKYITTYDGYKDAERLTGINESSIRKCCSGEIKSCKGYLWRIYEGNIEDLVGVNIKSTNHGNPKIPIDQYSLSGEFLRSFDSATAAAKWLDNKHAKTPILQVCRGQRKTAYNYLWKFKKES